VKQWRHTARFLALSAALACAKPVAAPEPGAVAAEYAAQERWPEASREIELAIRREPADAALRLQAASIYRRSGSPDDAIRHLEAALQIEPSNPEIWIELGDVEKGRENIQDAYVAYRRAADLAPDDLRAVSGLALTADTLGFDAEAEAAYRRWSDLENGVTPPPSPGD